MKILQDLSLAELKTELSELIDKMPRFRAEQVYKWANEYVSFENDALNDKYSNGIITQRSIDISESKKYLRNEKNFIDVIT